MKILKIISGVLLALVACGVVSQTPSIQHLISPAGNHLETSGYTLSWSVGEVVTSTLENESNWLTQGFHQGSIEVETSWENVDLDIEINAYPNPAQDYVVIKLSDSQSEGIYYRLVDFQGRILAENKIDQSQTRISLEKYDPGVYLVKLHGSNQHLKTFKIIKH